MNIVSIITARKGSKRLPNKNMLILGKKPLVSWTIDFAKSLKVFKNIFITTDDPRILKISIKKKILAPWLRPKKLSQDKSSSYLTVLHAINWYEKKIGTIDCICLLQPTTPFRNKKNLLNAIRIFKKEKKSVISVAHKKIKNLHLDQTNKKKLFNAYVPSGSFFLISPKELKKFKNFLNENNYLYLIKDKKENIDINNISDWKISKRYIDKK